MRSNSIDITTVKDTGLLNRLPKSDDANRMAVRVVRMDEERMIATTVCRVLGLPGGKDMCHEDEED